MVYIYFNYDDFDVVVFCFIVGKLCDVELNILDLFWLEDIELGVFVVEFERLNGCKEFLELFCVNFDGMLVVIFILYEFGEYLIYVYKNKYEV